MALGKQAKTLTEKQISAALNSVNDGRYPLRDRVMILLSVKAGLRAKEISCLTWGMVTDAEGRISECLRLVNNASKGKSGGREVPMHKELRAALIALKGKHTHDPDDNVITSERGDKMRAASVVNWFKNLYDELGFNGCTSHSGRRTFITNVARRVSQVGASLRDVQQMAGHSNLNTTQRYIEGDSEAKRKLINLI